MFRFLLSLYFVFQFNNCFSTPHVENDTTQILISKQTSSVVLKTAVAGTCSQNNSSDQNQISISIKFNTDYLRKVTSKKFTQYYQFNFAYGYLRLDSIWMKNTDFWKLRILFSEMGAKKITHTYSFFINSQLTTTNRRVYNYKEDLIEMKKVSGFFNPGNITLGYGLNWMFWDDNYLNVNFATIKVFTRPRYSFNLKDDSNIGKLKYAYVFCEYGMSINTMVYKYINSFLRWENSSNMFMNGINKSSINFDIINRLNFIILKHLEFKIDTHLIYDLALSSKVQLQNDFTIGYFYQFNKRSSF